MWWKSKKTLLACVMWYLTRHILVLRSDGAFYFPQGSGHLLPAQSFPLPNRCNPPANCRGSRISANSLGRSSPVRYFRTWRFLTSEGTIISTCWSWKFWLLEVHQKCRRTAPADDLPLAIIVPECPQSEKIFCAMLVFARWSKDYLLSQHHSLRHETPAENDM